MYIHIKWLLAHFFPKINVHNNILVECSIEQAQLFHTIGDKLQLTGNTHGTTIVLFNIEMYCTYSRYVYMGQPVFIYIKISQ